MFNSSLEVWVGEHPRETKRKSARTQKALRREKSNERNRLGCRRIMRADATPLSLDVRSALASEGGCQVDLQWVDGPLSDGAFN